MTVVVLTETGDGGSLYHLTPGASYNASWNDTDADDIPADYSIEQSVQPLPADPSYTISRMVLIFDTSTIPSGSTVNSAVLSIPYSDLVNVEDFDIVIQNGQPTYPHVPLEVGDYDQSKYAGDGGSINTTEIGGSPFEITLNATGRSWLNLGGTTKLMLRSSLEIAADDPPEYGTNELVTGVEAPELTVDYDAPSANQTMILTGYIKT